ncbi:MAG: radical SAM protein [Candidatus Omnitrophica bacterium]|nr:radical SAM protein [Candidatus Omnitrophota bacterium]
MFHYCLDNINEQLVFFDSIKEDYLYNFSLALNIPLIGPHMLQLILTTRCNLQCAMCGVWRVKEKEIDTFYVKKLIDDAYRLGNLKEVYFTGGEALLRPDIFSLIKYVRDYYPHVRTHVNTNGTLLDHKTINRLFDSGLETLGISIDSPKKEIHDSLRGAGVFEKIIDALEYINVEKQRRNTKYPLVDTCSVLMDQTLDTMYEMIDFCEKYNVCGIHIQPYVCNSDLKGRREDRFWIPPERLPLLKDTLDKIKERNFHTWVHIEVPHEKIYTYFSSEIYVDKCYAGFCRALAVGEKICFVCNGPNKEKDQHFGLAEKDSLFEVWSGLAARSFRETIKNCKANCVQFCSIRPSADTLSEIHQRLMEHNNFFLLMRELHFLEEYIHRYPQLPLRPILVAGYHLIEEHIDDFIRSLEQNLRIGGLSAREKDYLESDLRLLETYIENAGKKHYGLLNSLAKFASFFSPPKRNGKNIFLRSLSYYNRWKKVKQRIDPAKMKFIFSRLIGHPFVEPQYFMIEITDHCNLRCPMCQANKCVGHLDFSMFTDLLEQIDEFKNPHKIIQLTGGEPLLHPDFSRIAETVKNDRRSFHLSSNGMLLDRFLAETVSFDLLNISLDGFPSAHDEIRGAGAFARVTENLRKLYDFVQHKGVRFEVCFNILITRYNYQDLYQLVRYLHQLYPYSKFQLLNVVDDNTNVIAGINSPLADIEHPGILFDQIGKIEGYCRFHNCVFFYPQAYLNYLLSKKYVNWKCFAGYNRLSITANGDVWLCSSTLGNISSRPLKQIWYSPEARTFRDKAKKCKVRCFQDCYMYKNI